MIRPLAVIGALFLLSGCSTGTTATSAPVPVPQVPAPPVATLPPRRGREMFAADWTGPSIGLTGFITENGELDVGSAHAAWLTFNRPGCQGADCVDPGPNAFYRCRDGALHIHSDNPGWPLLSVATFDGPISLQTVVTCVHLGSADAFAGPVIYHRETIYRAIYFSPSEFPGKAEVRIWGPKNRTNVLMLCDIGRPYTFRMDYADGGFVYYVNGAAIAAEHRPGDLLDDETTFDQPPRIGWFMGIADISIGQTDVWG